MGSGLGRSVKWRVYAYGVPAMAWAAFMMVTALAPSLGPIEDIDIVAHQDKLVHFAQYFILAFLTFLALVRGTRRERSWQLQTTIVSVVAYGILLEVEKRTEGSMALGIGTLYSAIKRLRERSLMREVDAPGGIPEDPRRRYYELTSLGRAVVEAEARRLESLVLQARQKAVLPAPEATPTQAG